MISFSIRMSSDFGRLFLRRFRYLGTITASPLKSGRETGFLESASIPQVDLVLIVHVRTLFAPFCSLE